MYNSVAFSTQQVSDREVVLGLTTFSTRLKDWGPKSMSSINWEAAANLVCDAVADQLSEDADLYEKLGLPQDSETADEDFLSAMRQRILTAPGSSSGGGGGGARAKLTPEQRAEIVRLRKEENASYKDLSTKFGVSPPAINSILRAAGLTKTARPVEEILAKKKEELAKLEQRIVERTKAEQAKMAESVAGPAPAFGE